VRELFLEKPDVLSVRNAQPLPAPKDNEVKLRIIYGGICGSDLRVYKGSIVYAAYPLRPGHEVLGVVVEAGKDSSLAVGTKVVVFPNTYCGECEFCQSGQTNICTDKKPMGVTIDGVFAQEVLVDSKYAVPVPAELADERAILIEPFAVVIHALKKATIRPGTSLAVIGCGAEGLLTVAFALKMGAQVTAIDINPKKHEIVKKLGDVKTMLPGEANGATFDIVVEAAGVKAAIEQAISLVKPGGTMIALGVTGDPVSYIPIHIVRSEISIRGTIIYTKSDFADAIKNLLDPSFNVAPVVSKFTDFERCQEAYADALTANFGKIVLAF
jgi:L-iditol 2-dehydrogenase